VAQCLTKEVSIMPFIHTGLGLIGGIVCLIFGIIIMIFPKILNYLVGIWLIVVGIIALIAHFT
jgi:uncharacterized membrane protein HdeD (DUF308 family)